MRISSLYHEFFAERRGADATCILPRTGAGCTWSPPESAYFYSTRLRGFRFLPELCAVITLDSSLQVRFRQLRQGGEIMSWAPVYAFVKRIPRGRVITYGGVAKALRLRGGARSAGRAMAASPSGKGVPWHRVVGYGGKLLIREPYASLQRKLLESEGVAVLESRVNMKKHAWPPTREMSRKLRPTKPKRPN